MPAAAETASPAAAPADTSASGPQPSSLPSIGAEGAAASGFPTAGDSTTLPAASTTPDVSADSATATTSAASSAPNPGISLAAQVVAPQSGAAASSPTAKNGVPLVDITLDTPGTLADINASKDNKLPGQVTIDDPSAQNQDFKATAATIKSRGNFTWTLPKKAYQIKFDKKQNLLGIDGSGQKGGKTWVLLANYADASLVRDKVAYDLADRLGLSYSPKSAFVDLTVNGEFLGSYLLCDKVEVSTNRVNLTDPQGVLVELDNAYGATEPHNFTSVVSGTRFVLDDSVEGVDDDALDPDTQAGWNDMQSTINNLERLLYAQNPDWGQISQLIDVDSFSKYFLLAEFTENSDTTASSVYFYKDGTSDKLHMGPAWDYDIALGNSSLPVVGSNPTESYITNIKLIHQDSGNDWFREFFRNPEFIQRTNQIFTGTGKNALAQVRTDIETNRTTLKASAAANFVRWPILGKRSPLGDRTLGSTFDSEVDRLKTWTDARVAYMNGVYGSDIPVVSYTVQVQNMGWQPPVTGGMWKGTTGQGLRLETLNMNLIGSQTSGGIQADAHVQNIGWTGRKPAGSDVGSVGQGLRMEAFKLQLTGDLASKFDIVYRAYVQNYGWLGWTRNGAVAGTTGMGLRIESVQIQLVRKGTAINSSPFASYPAITYSSHVQNIGWQAAAEDGGVSGTTGQGLRTEALRASLGNIPGGVTYQSHVQNVGWLGWASDGGISGTTGMGLQQEAFKIRLTGDAANAYDVYYRAHVQNFGWLGWTSNGQPAGSSGFGYGLEALQVVLIPRGGAAPGSTSNSFLQG